jgi:hypothetical protein
MLAVKISMAMEWLTRSTLFVLPCIGYDTAQTNVGSNKEPL